MERRLLLAIALTFIVLTAYQWLVPSPPQPAAQAPAAPGAAAPASTPQSPSSAAQTPPPAAAPESTPPVETVKADAAERTITVENGLVRAVFSSRGATLTSWELTAYRGPDGNPVDLVPHDLPPNQPRPFSLELDDATKSARVKAEYIKVDAPVHLGSWVIGNGLSLHAYASHVVDNAGADGQLAWRVATQAGRVELIDPPPSVTTP